MAMSQQQYIKSKGVKCPFCGSEDISGEEVNIDGGSASQSVSCMECNASWNDHYHLGGYEIDERPETEDLAEITPEDPGDPVMYFVVSGRIPGDDEDTTLTFALPENATREDVAKAFEDEMYADRSINRENIIVEYDSAVYINAIHKSLLPIEEI